MHLYLGSQGTRRTAERKDQVIHCEALQAQVLAGFDALETEAARADNGARVFCRIAYMLQGLDTLPLQLACPHLAIGSIARHGRPLQMPGTAAPLAVVAKSPHVCTCLHASEDTVPTPS